MINNDNQKLFIPLYLSIYLAPVSEETTQAVTMTTMITLIMKSETVDDGNKTNALITIKRDRSRALRLNFQFSIIIVS